MSRRPRPYRPTPRFLAATAGIFSAVHPSRPALFAKIEHESETTLKSGSRVLAQNLGVDCAGREKQYTISSLAVAAAGGCLAVSITGAIGFYQSPPATGGPSYHWFTSGFCRKALDALPIQSASSVHVCSGFRARDFSSYVLYEARMEVNRPENRLEPARYNVFQWISCHWFGGLQRPSVESTETPVWMPSSAKAGHWRSAGYLRAYYRKTWP
ncbi:hypothetical protein DFH08DRAFT_801653 [Mycena albidolilacea]|uniref:Uncharacterized protein n=1 Tax=Mycena albidolilacea TaxID=1033008 RepID=A0AAD7EZ18_9AGAR|nr:hypothetical protein DFH08DRAFT_801653 [Mycena albidolilacea]